MHPTLEKLKEQCQAISEYEAAREASLGARDAAGKRALRRLATAQQALWVAAGGKAEEFALAHLLKDKLAPPKASAPKGSAPAQSAGKGTGNDA